MSKYSPIAPLPILQELHTNDLLGNYLLLLVHEVLKDPRGYIDLIDEIENTGDNPRFVVIDNGLIELGEALSMVDVIEAAALVEADCIIVPDVLGDFPATQKAVMEQVSILRNSGFPLMKVPQGSDIGQIVQCTDWLREYLATPNGDPDYWGIPRWIANEMWSRIPIVQYINASNANPKIHLLGMSSHLEGDLRCLTMPNVMGIDSANPLVMGFAGKMIEVRHTYTHMIRGDFFEQTHLGGCVVDNVQWMHNACN